MNNHWNDLYTPKYFWEGTKGRKSRIFVDACCPLTGYYIDNCILDPIYQFLKSPTENITFDCLMNECLDSFSVLVGMIWKAPGLWNTSRKKATPTVGNTFQTENYSINYQHLKLIIMKKNKKVQTNSVQKSEKENAVKVTALAIIPKPMTLLTPQDVPTATEVTETPETATVPTVTEEAPQQATFKTPLATATAETDLDSPPYTQARTTTARRSMTHPCRNLRKAFGKWESCRPLRYAHARKTVMKSYTVNAVTVPHCLQEQRP